MLKQMSFRWQWTKNTNGFELSRDEIGGETSHITLRANSSNGALELGDHSLDAGKLVLHSESTGQTQLQAPTSITSTHTLILPNTDGNDGDVLTTDGAGNLSWASPASMISLCFGRSGNMSNTTEELRGVHGSANTQGYRATTAYRAVNMSLQFRCSSVSGSRTITLSLYKNGSASGDTISTSVSSTGVTGMHGSVDVDFAQGDRIGAFVVVPNNITIRDAAAYIDLEM